MTHGLTQLLSDIKPYQEQLGSHTLYQKLRSFEALKQFMSYHVFAVWDFMNLLCYLQKEFTHCQVPWQPPKHPQIARLINDIKLEEESDLIDGEAISHFQYYVKSMMALNIPTQAIDLFLNTLSSIGYEQAILHNSLKPATQTFLKHTKDTLEQGPIAVAASFTFGRETLIPIMFVEILDKTPDSPEIKAFKTYLERHIQLDGEEHGQMATELVQILCQNQSDWSVATAQAIAAIQARIRFYSDIESHLS